MLNLLPADDKSNLQALTASGSGEVPVPVESSSHNILDISKFFKPFSKDPAKQARYDSYLAQVKCGNKGNLKVY